MKRLMKKAALLSVTFIVALPTITIAQIDVDRVASVTCAVMAASRNIDSAFRVKEINNARYDIGVEPYLLGDDLIKESIALGTCGLLVKNSPDWARVHEKKIAAFLAIDAKKKEIAKRSRAASDFYNSNSRIIVIPNMQTVNVDKYMATSVTLTESLDISKAYKGETVSGKLNGYYADCVIPHFSHQSSSQGWTRSVIEGAPICKSEKPQEGIYHSDYANNKSEVQNKQIAYRVKQKKGSLSICFYASGFSVGCAKNKTIDDFTFTTGFVYKKD